MAMCEQCGQNPATIRFAMIVNGKKTEKMLCQSCMREMRRTMPNIGLDNIAGMIGSLLSARRPKGDTAQIGLAPDDDRYAALICPQCGMEYEEFRKGGMVGCTACYRTFREPIEEVLTRVNGNVQHVGRVPGGKGSALSNKLAIDRLKQQLGRAIAEEEYERAASLRDQIRALTAQAEEGKNDG